MYETIDQFIAQFVIAYMLFSAVLVSIAALFLKVFPLNAAARHRIWLTALIVLVITPLLSLIPRATIHSTPTVVVANPLESDSRSAALSTNSQGAEIVQATRLVFESESSISGLRERTSVTPFRLDALSKAFVEAPLYRELSLALLLIMSIGLAIKLYHYLRSLYSLAVLIDSSETLGGEWSRILERSCSQMNIQRRIQILHSSSIGTPSTCGVFSPRIILPTSMVNDGCLAESVAQIIYHELAHIKRHDPLIAGLIALLSVFYFWHPAVNFIARKIRFEREIACDDWVIRNSSQHGDSDVKAYAYSLVGIAESLRAQSSVAHTLACVEKEAGLQTRIGTLLDRQLDHSTTVDFVPNVSMTALALMFLYFAASLLPRVPSDMYSADTIPAIGIIEASPPVRAGARTIAELRPETIEPIDASDRVSVLQIADYEVPMPVLDTTPIASRWKSDVILSRAERLKSTFLSQLPDSKQASGVTVDPIDLEPSEFPLESINEFRSHAAMLAIGPFDSVVPQAESAIGKDTEKLSKSELAAQILNVELEIYRIFNAVTEREDLKMVCEKGVVLGSYISQTTCEPEFLRTARSENARDRIITSKYQQYSVPANLRTNLEAGYAEFAAELLKEMHKNQQLLSLYQTLTALKVQQADAA